MWLQLTDQDGEPIWINFEAVTAMKGTDTGTRIDTGTPLATPGAGVHAYYVRESPERVLSMLEAAVAEVMDDLEDETNGRDN